MKQISAKEMHEIVGKLLVGDEIDDADVYARFFTELAELVCDYAGGYVVGDADDGVGEWLTAIEGDDSLPDPSVFDEFDPEGVLDRS